jgi:hypothetical protein
VFTREPRLAPHLRVMYLPSRKRTWTSIPLSILGVTSYFPTRNPTKNERGVPSRWCYLELTAESPIWDPHSTMFNDLELRLVDRNGKLEDNPGTYPRQFFSKSTETLLHEPFMKLRVAGITTTKGPGNWNAKLLPPRVDSPLTWWGGLLHQSMETKNSQNAPT